LATESAIKIDNLRIFVVLSRIYEKVYTGRMIRIILYDEIIPIVYDKMISTIILDFAVATTITTK